MNKRKHIQQSHERAVVKDFLGWLNAKRGTCYKVIAEPNPPDAVIRSIRRTRWVEVGDVFWTDKYARDLYSYATPGETRKAVGPGPFVDMDKSLAKNFIRILEQKLSKKTYKTYYEKYGSGFLILCINHSWFDKSTIEEIKNNTNKINKSQHSGYFSDVFISFSSLNRRVFMKWKEI